MTRRKALIVMLFGVLFPVCYFFVKKGAFFNTRPRRQIGDYQEIIAEIADTIIPRTDTPGAKDAFVATYIINVVKNCENKTNQMRFILGLERLEEESIKRFSMAFASASANDKAMLLQELENKKPLHPLLNKIKNKVFGLPFFDQFKMLTIKGYCISQAGATKGLAYDRLPGSYIACTPYYPHQKSWATR